MKYLQVLLIIFCPALSSAQYGKQFNLMNNRVIVNHPESTVYAFVVSDNEKRKTDDAHFYYWFASNDIKKTRGTYEGKLLHGYYTEFYLNKNLKEKGKIRYGLRQGRWNSWYPNGEYKEIVYYKKSRRLKHKAFYNTGAIQSEGKYRNDKLHGTVRQYSPEGKMEKVKYKRGQVVIKKKIEIPKDSNGIKEGIWNRRKNKALADSVATPQVPEKSAVKRDKRGKKLQTVGQGADPIILEPVPGQPKKIKKHKEKKPVEKEGMKVRKFLWIIPLEPAPSKEKQT